MKKLALLPISTILGFAFLSGTVFVACDGAGLGSKKKTTINRAAPDPMAKTATEALDSAEDALNTLVTVQSLLKHANLADIQPSDTSIAADDGCNPKKISVKDKKQFTRTFVCTDKKKVKIAGRFTYDHDKAPLWSVLGELEIRYPELPNVFTVKYDLDAQLIEKEGQALQYSDVSFSMISREEKSKEGIRYLLNEAAFTDENLLTIAFKNLLVTRYNVEKDTDGSLLFSIAPKPNTPVKFEKDCLNPAGKFDFQLGKGTKGEVTTDRERLVIGRFFHLWGNSCTKDNSGANVPNGGESPLPIMKFPIQKANAKQAIALTSEEL